LYVTAGLGCHSPTPAERGLAPRQGPLERRAPAAVSAASPSRALIAAPLFPPEVYLGHVHFLASDELGGRGIGTEGIRQATRYIADSFALARLQPAGEDGTYFHNFDMQTGATLDAHSELTVSGLDATPQIGTDYMPLPFSSAGAFEGDVVFGGYGIVDADRQHDDFLHTDVTGKVVLVFCNEPPAWEPEEGHYTAFASFQAKISNAKSRDAAAILVVGQTPAEGEQDELMTFHAGPNTSDFGLPAIQITRALANRMLEAGGLESLDVLQKRLDEGEFCSAAVDGIRAKGTPGIVWNRSNVRNVVGILPGAGPLANEYVIVGAHHDHLGTMCGGSSPSRAQASDTPLIHNGADDNASGVAGVIELARACASGEPFNRSVVFMTFTAEESGLIGSQRFVSEPTFPLDRAVAMFNLDMVGRVPDGNDTVQVFGVKSADEFTDLVEEAGARRGLEVKTAGGAIGGSDHTMFFTKGIPTLHFFSGLHNDYHTPDDDADKINEHGAVKILHLVYDLIENVANRDTRLTYNAAGGGGPQRRTTGFKVIMGIMPSYTESEIPGMEVVAVSPGKPAEASGMQGGDRIIRINDKTVNNVYDYMAALSGSKPGDTAEVVVTRGDEEIVLSVVLAAGR
jgi:hypothetical protein